MDIGKTIISLRKQQGLSQKKLAELTGISANALCSIEKGYSFPSKKNIKAICSSLRVSTAYLLFKSLTDDDVPKEKLSIFKAFQIPMLEILEKEEMYEMERNTKR
jgi:transcriptional regulator with XRE-family HTH domain